MDKMTEEIEKHLTEIYATFAEPSSYNRFHINRIKDIMAGNPAFYNDLETERRFITADMSQSEKLEWIASEFANMVWKEGYRGNDIDEKTAFFESEITSFEKANLWIELAEIQLVPKGLMLPNS